jgi:hypothetical protein
MIPVYIRILHPTYFTEYTNSCFYLLQFVQFAFYAFEYNIDVLN